MVCSTCGTRNPPGMRFCGMCGSRLERQLTVRERRRVSVLFVDLAGFSSLTHGLDPEELRDLADEVLTMVAGIIEEYDGHVDAFRGDGLIALFGAPHSHPDDANRAVLAASASLEAIRSIGRSRGIRLEGRAGVNTGVVIAGSVGSGRVRSYTVMGSAVNLAARLEEAATPGEVWVGDETFETTRNRLAFEETGPLQLPGFPAVRRAHRLVSTVQRRESDPYADIRFVGRAEELRALREAYDQTAASGRARELWLVGEAGRGKTRLLNEFLKSVSDALISLWIEVHPTEEFSWQALEPQLFGADANEEGRVRQQRVQEVVQRLLPGEPRWHQAILRSLDLVSTKSWTRLDRRNVDRTNLAWRDLVVALARSGGEGAALVVAIDNEPRDETLLEFLALLRTAEAPILLLRTSRWETLPDEAESLALGPLDYRESVALLDELASPEMRTASEALVRQVGGVPAYVLELGRALSLTQSGSFSGSLASLLQSRLDMVEAPARLLLAQAALTGEATWERLLLELAAGNEQDLVAELVDQDLLVRETRSTVPEDIEYRFQSELLRQAVLRMIPFSDRPLLHLKIATWLESHAPLSFSELIAEHFERGGSPDAAYAHYLAAADQADAHGDPERANDLYERLLGLDLGADQLAEGALAYANAALARGDRARAIAALTRAHAWIEQSAAGERDELERVEQRLRGDAEALA